MKKINIIVADDHAILRYGICMFLSRNDDIDIAGEASTGEECIALYKEHQPDVCVVDIDMPEKDGLEVTKTIKAINPDAKILILSMYLDEAILTKALKAGIDGYMLKNAPKENILQAIRAIHKGQQAYSDDISKMIPPADKNVKDSSQNHPKDLTNRELDVLYLVVGGHSSPEIAEKLFISRRTVDTHRNNMMRKLNINNTASLVRFAIEHDLVKTPGAKHTI